MGGLGRGQLAACAVGALLVLVAVGRLLDFGGGQAGGEPRVALDGAGAGGPASRGSPDGAGAKRPDAYVHVAGAVRRPGLYRVSEGARVAAAVAHAGGPSRRAELAGVNLAARVRDGQQVVVPVRGAGGAPAAADSGGAVADTTGGPGGSGGAPLSLSQATPEQLDTLDGIGPKLAARILEYRKANGGFASLEQLREVEGIGPKRFEALRSAVQP